MMNGYAYGFGGLVMVLFWVFVVALIVWLVLTLARAQNQPGSTGTSTNSALRILQERLARGEIDVEEYRLRRTALDEGAR